MKNIDLIYQLKYILDSYVDDDCNKVDIISGDLLTDEDFILLLNKILSNYVERNFNRT